MLGLFDTAGDGAAGVREPLAARMRPRTLDEFVGQEQIVGPGRALRRAIESDALPSMILWGPPGTGKTTLAQIIAVQTGAHFAALSAVSAGVADLRRVVADAAKLKAAGRRSVLFIDEIHRFNKAQQDAVLPYVEDGTVTLIGATTENPSFEVNSALLSRARVFVLTALDDDAIRTLLERALHDPGRGLGALDVAIEPDALDALVGLANGDARVALSTLEFAASAAPRDADGHATIGQQTVADALQQRARTYDKDGDGHYDTISAFIKTVRGSDPDAAVYYLARMIESGEDPLFLARRLVILASEDIGLADRHALPLAIAAQQAVHFIGMPEGFYPLAHATIYLATAPKSNTVGRAYTAALADVTHARNEPVPLHLRNAPTKLMRQLGYGAEYRYAHTEYAAMDAVGDVPPAVALQSNLPEALAGRHYFEPTRQGDEARLRSWIDERRSAGDAAVTRIYLDHAATTPARPETIAAMVPLLGAGGYNPSSIHAEGRAARAALDGARASVANALGAKPREIVFTGGGSESISLALLGVARARAARGRHIVSCVTEHHAVLHTLDVLEEQGWSTTRLPVDAQGRIDPAAFAAALRPDTTLASIMFANNEIGTIAPIAELAALAHRAGVIFHTDAVQAPAAVALDVAALGVDLLSISAHKFYGPKGVGALYVRSGTPIVPLILGGGQEHGLRAGTENVAGIAGLAVALERAQSNVVHEATRLRALRDRLEAGIRDAIPGVRVNAGDAPRLAGLSSVAFADVASDALLIRLDLEGIAASAGSACAAGSLEPSHVVAALGLPSPYASGVIRFSLGAATSDAEIDRVIALLPQLVMDVRVTESVV